MKQAALSREEVIELVNDKCLKQSKAAVLLGISVRQIKRLCRDYRLQGTKGLISKKQGQSSPNHIPANIKNKIIELAKEKYKGFGPQLMSEKLETEDTLKISRETLRQILISEKIWKPKKEKKKSVHQRRERRSCFGELVQIDGSPHAWFEDRAPKCCLIVFIDDATSHIIYLQFEPVESTAAYLRGIQSHLTTYGIPLAYYSDKHQIFKVNNAQTLEVNNTQFERVCATLAIEGICAHSPQAKGRVERVNRTLQDRLVKELRLAGISSIIAGNQFLKTYVPLHNQRFAVEPANLQDAHVKNTLATETLDDILSVQSTRKLSKNLELSFNNKIYQVLNEGYGRRLQQSLITVCEHLDGTIHLLHQERRLDYKTISVRTKVKPVLDEKLLNQHLDAIQHLKRPAKPAENHPWRKYDANPACFKRSQAC
jgi:transposase